MIQILDDDIISRYVFQEEIGEKGTPHLQGFFSFKKKDRSSKLNNKRIHFEVAKDRANNYRKAMYYCYNQEKRAPEGRLWYKNVRIQEKLNIPNKDNLYTWEIMIINELVLKEPHDREIWWVFDQWGGVGKTTFCKYLCYHHGFIPLNGKAADMRNAIVDYDKTNFVLPDSIVINIPATFDTNYLSYEGIESVKDMFFYSGKYEGGVMVGNSPRLIVFANEMLDWEKFSRHRVIRCYEIKDGQLWVKNRPHIARQIFV